MKESPQKLSLTIKISISLILGILVGLALQHYSDFAVTYIKPIGTIYLNLIKMVVVPVVLLSIIQGIVSLQDIKKVGSIGIQTLAYYTCTTSVAVTVGLLFANVLQVGSGYTLPSDELSYTASQAPSFIDTIVNIFPSNAFAPLVNATMLQVIVIAMFFDHYFAQRSILNDRRANAPKRTINVKISLHFTYQSAESADHPQDRANVYDEFRAFAAERRRTQKAY